MNPTYPTAHLPSDSQGSVRAFEIKKVIPNFLTGGAILIPKHRKIPEMDVTREFVQQQQPVAGGYYVIDDADNQKVLSRSQFKRMFTQLFKS